MSDSYKLVGIVTHVETSSVYGEGAFEMRRNSIVKQQGNGQVRFYRSLQCAMDGSARFMTDIRF